MTKFRYGSVCSGIEAATAAWHPLGWEPAFFSEIEPFPRAVLAHHYPDVPLHGDFTTIQGDEYGTIDLLVGGTPCQSFSVAGLRGGLDDDRGNLALEFLRLAQRTRPRWLVWENVPGVLSSNGGRDFGSILGGLVELGYGFAYRVLDAQYFGVAQRRRRVFVVGYLGDASRAAAVLFERHGLQGHPAPSRKKGKDIAGTVTRSSFSGGASGKPDGAAGNHFVTADQNDESVGALCARTGRAMSVQDADQGHIVTASCLTARGAGGLNLDPETSNLIPAIPFDLAQITSATNRSKAEEGMPAPTMSKSSHMHVAFPIDTQNMSPGHNSGGLGFGDKDDPSFTLTKGHSHAVAYAIQERAVCENPKAGPDGAGFRDDDAAYTLEARSVTQAVAYSIMPMNSGKDFKARETDVAQPLMAAGPVGGNQGGDFVAASAVRRLTPVECERLQGFPDNFTLIPWRGKAPEDCPDGPRYKALGNSMAVPVMRWIGERIMKVEGLLND